MKSNTGSRARWRSTASDVGTITGTGMSYMDLGGKVTQVSNEQLLALRSGGARCGYDISTAATCLGRVVVGQAVSLVVAEVVAGYCARAHRGK